MLMAEPILEYRIWQRGAEWHWQVMSDLHDVLASGIANSSAAVDFQSRAKKEKGPVFGSLLSAMIATATGFFFQNWGFNLWDNRLWIIGLACWLVGLAFIGCGTLIGLDPLSLWRLL